MNFDKNLKCGSRVWMDGQFYVAHFRERISCGDADDLVGLTHVPLTKSKRSRLVYKWMSELSNLERRGRAILIASGPSAAAPRADVSATPLAGGAAVRIHRLSEA